MKSDDCSADNDNKASRASGRFGRFEVAMKIRKTIAAALLACVTLGTAAVAQPPAALGPGFQPPANPVPAMPSYFPPTSILGSSSPQTIENLPEVNGFDEKGREPGRSEFNLFFDYAFLWIKRPNYPPLVTTGSTTDAIPGALGQPNTRVLLGGSDIAGVNRASAGRFGFLCLPGEYEWLGFDGNFMIMEQRVQTSNLRSDSTGSPLLTRPYFDLVTGAESADPRSFPGALTGTLTDSFTTNLMGAELNLRLIPVSAAYENSFSFLFGPRWIRYQERYQTYDTLSPVPDTFGTRFTISDDFKATNQIFAGQIGAASRFRWDRLAIDLTGKFFAGANQETLRIAGRSTATDITTLNTVVDNEQGLLAQTSNSGTYTRSRGIFGLDLGFAMNIDLSDHIGFKFGYNFLLLNHILRPSDVIDRKLQIQPIGPSSGDTAPFGPAPPTFQDKSLWIQGIDLGLNIRF